MDRCKRVGQVVAIAIQRRDDNEWPVLAEHTPKRRVAAAQRKPADLRPRVRGLRAIPARTHPPARGSGLQDHAGGSVITERE